VKRGWFNGVGIPADMDPQKSETLGMQTIFEIAGHPLGAEVTLVREHGVTWRICFAEDRYQAGYGS
jgi:two-component sensor histidine kinase